MTERATQSSSISPEILESLTRVTMPRGFESPEPDRVAVISGYATEVYRCQSLVLGTGAAGLRAACELKRRGRDVLVATGGMYMGTSACSGSDKQTIHTASTSRNGDNFEVLAKDLSSGGCMDEDVAYTEAVGSINAMAGLQYIGLELPEDNLGGVLRYQTDHDEYGRATSCGPRTSRLMVKVLLQETKRLGIPVLTNAAGVQILTTGEGENKKACGLVVATKSDDLNPYGLAVIECDELVIATGGPGEMYRDSAYPKKCYGSLGLALEAGITLSNLTESQFGIGTPRYTFPWNLSGTYVQVMPYVFSRDEDGNEYNFLSDYYRTTREMVSNVFRKGYQWPFHASRMLDFGSSLMDIAVHLEIKKGRKVYLDFLRNPLPVEGAEPFSLDNLDADVRSYLENNEALGELPIDRLIQMNPLAIELYRMNGIDVTKEPLLMTVNNQHMNGGIDIDHWGRTNLEGVYAVGEAASTHGVTRPGGSALTSGQVFGMRVAKHIEHKDRAWDESLGDSHLEAVAPLFAELEAAKAGDAAIKIAAMRDEIQARMSDSAGFICDGPSTANASGEATALWQTILGGGLALETENRSADYFMWKQMALSSAAVLTALDHYISNGGGSRGARMIYDETSTIVPQIRSGVLSDFAYRPEQDADKAKKIIVTYEGDKIVCSERTLRARDKSPVFFEKGWGGFLKGDIYES
ncbi:FAD-binding protein [Rhodobacteraceae bacterium RKSG542]|uniref:FAD-dependent oxidoreductase n=1 Tax=Pseudovibrio flavus TaxID=2529854 RepID=UPI0012BD33E5|nr:FAD-binding protein [Pseudovibrio flavus]MTI15981.1 FAD-binding protein [Pseudovibrio flavus]